MLISTQEGLAILRKWRDDRSVVRAILSFEDGFCVLAGFIAELTALAIVIRAKSENVLHSEATINLNNIEEWDYQDTREAPRNLRGSVAQYSRSVLTLKGKTAKHMIYEGKSG